MKNSNPLPRIDETIDNIGNARYSSLIDLGIRYYHMKIAKKYSGNIGFHTKFARFEFIAVPFGLINGPVAFMSMMKIF